VNNVGARRSRFNIVHANFISRTRNFLWDPEPFVLAISSPPGACLVGVVGVVGVVAAVQGVSLVDELGGVVAAVQGVSLVGAVDEVCLLDDGQVIVSKEGVVDGVVA
jgi:hypothetical protein